MAVPSFQYGPQNLGAPAGVAPQPRFRLPPAVVAVVTICGLCAGSFLLLVEPAQEAFAYRVGTPTTVTDVHCRGSRPPMCTGTWSTGGKSYTGTVEGPSRDTPFVDARVHGDTAYTADAASRILYSGIVVLAVVTLVLVWAGVSHLWKRWITDASR